MTGRWLIAGTALLLSAPGSAIPPPQPAFAIYGPLTQCLAGYRVVASEAEAIIAGGWLALQAEGFGLLLDRYADLPVPRAAGARASEVDVPHLGRVRRFDLPARPHLTPAVGESRERSTEYLLQAADVDGAVLVRSREFDGSARDLAMLARITRIDPARDRCGRFGPPEYAGHQQEAFYWSPVRLAGPRFRCQNGIGYAVATGEQLQLAWANGSSAHIWSRLHARDVMLATTGPDTPARRIGRARGPVAAGYIQTTQDQGAGGLLTLLPPGPRGERPWMRQITIRYAPGQEDAARALAGRLEFVDGGDSRCRPELERR